MSSRTLLAARMALAALALPMVGPVAAHATEPKQSEAGPLVSTEWLEANLASPKLRIVDVSVEPGVYERGHVPRAQNVLWHTDL
ncbi:rhodanese-like domain-containing protein [Methylobacterium sp. Leaf106]|uniref:rhodanese-like domain-containing protein n=1 Tax=Methylobacterium sp. Leaf106 TaxID=1736255 RepID=UPI000A495106|nr:rhodanese-like domain-containing protein [Methylobacterium sp. Leaf106]